ncbi:MAG: hypothetical protein C4345_08045 [Chloroflexota bacterium]
MAPGWARAAQEWRHNAEALGDVVQHEADHQERTKGSFAKLAFRVPNERDSAGTTTVEINFPADHPIAFVSVRPHPGWTYTVERTRLAAPLEERRHCPDDDQAHPLERSGHLLSRFQRFVQRITGEEDQQANRQRQDELHRRPSQRTQEGVEQQTQGNRDHPDHHADQRIEQERREPRLRRGRGYRNPLLKARAVATDQDHMDGLALDPGVLERDSRSSETLKRRRRRDGEVPQRIVDQSLGDGDRLWPAVHDVQDDLAVAQHDALDAELLDRRRRPGEERVSYNDKKSC